MLRIARCTARVLRSVSGSEKHARIVVYRIRRGPNHYPLFTPPARVPSTTFYQPLYPVSLIHLLPEPHAIRRAVPD